VARLAAPRPTGIPPDVAASDAPAVQAVLAAGSWSASTGPIAAGPAAAGPGAVEHPAAAGRGPSTAVQRQAETGAVESAAGGADAPAAGGPAGAGGNRDQDMDELARKLYGRIRERLGAELLADRERAGLLVDA
jgi:hypothetical protein